MAIIDREFEPVSDDSDRATLVEEEFNEIALEAARAKCAPESDPDFDGKHCIECGDLIPKVRRELGRIRCVDCQQRKERSARLYGGGR